MKTLRTADIPTAKSGYQYDGVTPADSWGPCVCCGRDVRKPGGWVHVIHGGGVMLHKDDEDAYQPDGDDLGLQPVGSDCVRLIPREYRH